MKTDLNILDEAPVNEKTDAKDFEEIQGEKLRIPAMRADGKSLIEKAKAFVVSSIETMHEAQAISQECARRKKVIDERFSKVREKTKAAKLAADKANSEVIALIDELKKPYDDAMKVLDPKARDWQAAENRRLAEEAEKKRQEEQRKLDEARQKEIEEAKRKAEELAESGNPEEAEQAAELAVELAEKPKEIATVEAETVESAKGTSNRAHWKAVLYDMEALVKACAEGRAPMSLLKFDQSEGDAQARAWKNTKAFDGVAFKDAGVTAHKV